MLSLLLLAVGVAFVAGCAWLVFGWTGEPPEQRAVRDAINTTLQTLSLPLQGDSRR